MQYVRKLHINWAALMNKVGQFTNKAELSKKCVRIFLRNLCVKQGELLIKVIFNNNNNNN